MSFDPNKSGEWFASDVRRAQRWYLMKLYLKALAILAPIAALAVWAAIKWLG